MRTLTTLYMLLFGLASAVARPLLEACSGCEDDAWYDATEQESEFSLGLSPAWEEAISTFLSRLGLHKKWISMMYQGIEAMGEIGPLLERGSLEILCGAVVLVGLVTRAKRMQANPIQL